MPKVFVTQIPQRKDRETGVYVPVVNIAPAAEYGEIVTIMPPQAAFYNTKDLVTQMREALKEYDYEAGDCIVSLGDPAVIGVAFAVLGQRFGKFTVLKWDKNVERYAPARVVL